MDPIDENKMGEETPLPPSDPSQGKPPIPPTPPPLPPANLPVVPSASPPNEEPSIPAPVDAPDALPSLDIPATPPLPALDHESSEPPVAVEPVRDLPPAPPTPPEPGGLAAEPKRSGKKWVAIVLILLVLILLGGAAAAYFTGFVRLPFLNQRLAADQVFDRMYQAIAGIETTNYSLTLAVTTEPREAGARRGGAH